MPYSEAQKRASMKYNEKAYDRIALRVFKGDKDKIKAFAESNGESLNGFINRIIYEAISKEKPRE
ncbi:MAG: Arc family DNA-binding protein [Oscillospiraceae bacterium]|jgi:predicted HicB family RNase H-like nuclease|nr:Arc family DNA-binding protein [Oscillospiraceae bacterium]